MTVYETCGPAGRADRGRRPRRAGEGATDSLEGSDVGPIGGAGTGARREPARHTVKERGRGHQKRAPRLAFGILSRADPADPAHSPGRPGRNSTNPRAAPDRPGTRGVRLDRFPVTREPGPMHQTSPKGTCRVRSTSRPGRRGKPPDGISRTPEEVTRHRNATTVIASPSFIEPVRGEAMREAVVSGVGTGSQREVLRSLFERSGMCLARLDSGFRLVEVNADFSRQFGCLPAELGGRSFSDLLHADVRTQVSQQFARLLAAQGSRFTEPTIEFHQKDSTVFSAELTGFAVRSESSRTDGLMALVCPQGGSRTARSPASHRPVLTDIEARILEGVALGVSTVNLASMLYLSRGGIGYHIDNLMRKLKVKNRPAVVSKAYAMGLIRPGWPPRVYLD
ncbi:PAS domain S-box protein [Streptomyces sp. NPDC087270]|uniref:PAS domain S-box protein n=2 Tax=unclassified Streptomyces TaxID=2593676 RepID=UPI00382DFC85